MRYIHMMKYYSAIKRNEILIHATTWMNLENIMPSEINHTQKDKNCIIPLICICRIGKFTDTEARTEVARGWGEGWVRRLELSLERPHV